MSPESKRGVHCGILTHLPGVSRSFACATGFAVGAGGYDVQTAIEEIRKVRRIVSLEPLDAHHANVVDFVTFYAAVTLEGISYGASAPAASPPPGAMSKKILFSPFRPGMASNGLGTPKIDPEPYIWSDF